MNERILQGGPELKQKAQCQFQCDFPNVYIQFRQSLVRERDREKDSYNRVRDIEGG